MKSALTRPMKRVDELLARASQRRRVLIDARTAMNLAVLAPMVERLNRDPRIALTFAAPRPADLAVAAATSGLAHGILPRTAVRWRRFDVWALDKEILTDYDAVETAGFRKAVVRESDLDLNDGPLSIRFGYRLRKPMVSAIEIHKLD